MLSHKNVPSGLPGSGEPAPDGSVCYLTSLRVSAGRERAEGFPAVTRVSTRGESPNYAHVTDRAMPTPTVCREEIEALHAFFVRWYCGTVDRSAFARLKEALGPAFERVTPAGEVHDRATVLAGIRESYDAHETFDIEIRNVEPVAAVGERTLVRYEEWQTTPDGENGRLSTALFGPVEGVDADPSVTPVVSWQYLQETWLNEG